MGFQPRRSKARLRLGIPAELVTVHGRRQVTLLDLSETGARVQYDEEQIADGVLKWLGYEAFGSVVRRVGHDVGLKFDQPLESGWLLDTREWLSVIAEGEDELRRFAREWAQGRQSQAPPARVTGRRAEARPHLAAVAQVHAAEWDRRVVARSWLRAAKPYLLGGVVACIVAGCWSAIF